MNVTITNINQETLNAIEVLLKPFMLKDKLRIIKEDDEIVKVIKEFESDKKQGKTKIYNSLDEYKEAMSV